MYRFQPDVTTTEEHWLSGGGEMAARIRGFDWRRTPLGPAGKWPQSLKTTVRLMLGSPYQQRDPDGGPVGVKNRTPKRNGICPP